MTSAAFEERHRTHPHRLRRWFSPELDPLELQLRVDSVRAAVWTTLMVCPAVLVYVLLAGQRDNRTALCVLVVAAVIGSVLTLQLPWERLARSCWREAFYGGWWLTDFAAIVVATILDGGPSSPLLLLAFVLLVFTGLSYPRAMVVVLASITLLTFVVIVVVYHEHFAIALLQVSVLAASALMSYLQSRNHATTHCSSVSVRSRRRSSAAKAPSRPSRAASGACPRRRRSPTSDPGSGTRVAIS